MSPLTYETIDPTVLPGDFSGLIWALREELAVPAAYYPGFAEWFHKVVLELTEGMRGLVLAREQGRIIGVNILKLHQAENKLCTFWVNPAFRQRHIATALLDRSLACFGSESPRITVPQCVLGDFTPFVEQGRFLPVEAKKGLYRIGETEHFFRIVNPLSGRQARPTVKLSARHSSAALASRCPGGRRRA